MYHRTKQMNEYDVVGNQDSICGRRYIQIWNIEKQGKALYV